MHTITTQLARAMTTQKHKVLPFVQADGALSLRKYTNTFDDGGKFKISLQNKLVFNTQDTLSIINDLSQETLIRIE